MHLPAPSARRHLRVALVIAAMSLSPMLRAADEVRVMEATKGGPRNRGTVACSDLACLKVEPSVDHSWTGPPPHWWAEGECYSGPLSEDNLHYCTGTGICGAMPAEVVVDAPAAADTQPDNETWVLETVNGQPGVVAKIQCAALWSLALIRTSGTTQNYDHWIATPGKKCPPLAVFESSQGNLLGLPSYESDAKKPSTLAIMEVMKDGSVNKIAGLGDPCNIAKDKCDVEDAVVWIPAPLDPSPNHESWELDVDPGVKTDASPIPGPTADSLQGFDMQPSFTQTPGPGPSSAGNETIRPSFDTHGDRHHWTAPPPPPAKRVVWRRGPQLHVNAPSPRHH